MKALIICASKYGSTTQIGRWIAERLSYDGVTVDIAKPEDAISIDEYELIVMGSGIYTHDVLPSLRQFIDENKEVLKSKKLALFGVAMKTEPTFHKGKIHGGIEYLKSSIEKLDGAVIHADMLHGEMVYEKMDEKDKEGLLRFYKMLGLSDAEAKERLKPRTLMDKKEAWDWTEATLKKIKGISHYGATDEDNK